MPPRFLRRPATPNSTCHPTTTSGEYPSQAWIERNGKLVSTLDLVGRGVFTVLTGAGGKACPEEARVR